MGYAKNPDDFARRVVDEAFAALPEGLSLREVGRRTGIDHSQLSRLRDYKRMLDVDQLEALCAVAGVEPHVIVERAEGGGAADNVVEFPAAPKPPTEEDAHLGAQAAYRPKFKHESMSEDGDHLDD